VIVVWTQGVAVAAWLVFFAVSGRPFVAPTAAWPAVAASAVLVIGMNALLARASARGDISIVGPVFALSPVFTVIPDAVLSGTLPTALGWLGLALSVTGTVSLSGGAAGRGAMRSTPSARRSCSASWPPWTVGVHWPWGRRATSCARTAPPRC
jgi:drug/metabolite transporter (DMT)-like permease